MVRYVIALLGLTVPWIFACERMHARAPWALALFLLVPWLAWAVSFRAMLPPGWRATVLLVLGLVVADAVVELANPGSRLVFHPPWETARAVVAAAGAVIGDRGSPGFGPVKRALAGLAQLVAAGLVGTMAFLAIDGARDESPAAGDVDAVLLLGYALPEDGGVTTSLVARVDRAASLAHEKDGRFVVASGGSPKAGRTEAEAMHGLLRDRGIAPAAIVEEPAARSTIENFECAAPILRARGVQRALLVTEPWHLSRALLLSRRHAPGIAFVRAPAPSPAWTDPRRALFLMIHEAAGYLEELAFPSRRDPCLPGG